MSIATDPVTGIGEAEVESFLRTRAAKGPKRDSRVCVCGHGARSHFPLSSFGGPADIEAHEAGTIACQAGKTPCECQQFIYVLRATDIRSFIQKTEGPGEDHALAKGIKSSLARGVVPEWREGIACMICKGVPTDVGPLVPIAYNERYGEAMRPTPINRLHCQSCREGVQRAQANGNG